MEGGRKQGGRARSQVLPCLVVALLEVPAPPGCCVTLSTPPTVSARRSASQKGQCDPSPWPGFAVGSCSAHDTAKGLLDCDTGGAHAVRSPACPAFHAPGAGEIAAEAQPLVTTDCMTPGGALIFCSQFCLRESPCLPWGGGQRAEPRGSQRYTPHLPTLKGQAAPMSKGGLGQETRRQGTPGN